MSAQRGAPLRPSPGRNNAQHLPLPLPKADPRCLLNGSVGAGGLWPERRRVAWSIGDSRPPESLERYETGTCAAARATVSGTTLRPTTGRLAANFVCDHARDALPVPGPAHARDDGVGVRVPPSAFIPICAAFWQSSMGRVRCSSRRMASFTRPSVRGWLVQDVPFANSLRPMDLVVPRLEFRRGSSRRHS